MAIRIPLLIDIQKLDESRSIIAAAHDPKLDRDYQGRGPLINRLITRKIRTTVSVNGAPLPPVTPANAPGRKEKQAALKARLDSMGSPAARDRIDRLADHVRGATDGSSIGIDVQGAIGALFVPDYHATAKSWKAARIFDSAVHSFGSPIAFIRRLTGSLDRSRSHLAEKVGGDLAGVHATGIAVHNLVEAIKRMRALGAAPGALLAHSPAEAASLSMAAPTSVVREATKGGSNPAATYRPGTLVLLSLEKARKQSLGYDVALMEGSWSECPAHGWVPTLLATVWARSAELGRTSQ